MYEKHTKKNISYCGVAPTCREKEKNLVRLVQFNVEQNMSSIE